MSEASERKAVIADEKAAEKDERQRVKEASKRSFSISVTGTKESAVDQITEQVKDSGIAAALRALVATGPGNCVSLAGSMESNEDGSQGKIIVTGNFETIHEDILKAHADQQAAAAKARGKRK